MFLVEQAIEFHQVPLRLMVAEDGEAASNFLEQVEQRDNARVPAVVVLDLNLPKKSGAEILAQARNSPKFRNVPFIVLTSSDSQEDRKRVAGLGANRYVTKPASYREFLQIGVLLNDLLKGKIQF